MAHKLRVTQRANCYADCNLQRSTLASTSAVSMIYVGKSDASHTKAMSEQNCPMDTVAFQRIAGH